MRYQNTPRGVIFRLAKSPDVYIKPALTNIRTLDFYRYKEILAGVADEVRQFQETLKQLL